MNRAALQQRASSAVTGANQLVLAERDVSRQEMAPGVLPFVEPRAAGIDKAFAENDYFLYLCNDRQDRSKISWQLAPGRTEGMLHNRPISMLHRPTTKSADWQRAGTSLPS